MNLYDSLPDAAPTLFGEEAVGSFAYDVLTVDVPVGSWISALEIARDKLGCTYFDWLSAVDEPGTGFRICAHVVALENRRVRRLLLRTTVPHAAPSLPSAVAVYAGAEWHERETFEMFGVTFTDHPHLVHLLLPENFEGHPLRKDFVLAARVAKAWPGAKEPGEAHDPDAPKRRQMLPPGVPDPNDWGPLKGQLPPAPARPARAPRAGAAAARGARRANARPDAPARPRPAKRGRGRSPGASGAAQPLGGGGLGEPGRRCGPGGGRRRGRSPARPVRRSRSASEGSASQAAPAAPAAEPEAPAPAPRTAPRSSDAPWHDPKPAFEESPATPPEAKPEPKSVPKTDPPSEPDTTGGDA
ncbi:NADH-quinone oxidoreductase subunit C [Streptomyces sp. RerS4]|uniref:NADH-quinone oxidoreductase subunit C n=1 Tax=Streptomyces sp. RerS4 TaxID=2942449 RepID=UPI00201C5DCC|nr:NADH-quinone oxidoreductase subunit C [Streptomyces sp. RerS4]UQX02465.1 NADH-quinone oxidoreductase subunit C [Streptomyces sp. RerS4]